MGRLKRFFGLQAKQAVKSSFLSQGNRAGPISASRFTAERLAPETGRVSGSRRAAKPDLLWSGFSG